MLPPDGPLTRAAVLVDSRDSFLMYTCFHHAVADARGINLALSQVLTDYESLVGTGHDSGNEPPQYADFASAEREYRSSPAWTTDRDYFVENYRDVQPALLTRSGSVHSRRRHHHTLRVTPESAQRVRDTGRSIFAFTAAAIGEYLRRIHRGKDIILGVPFLNRVSEADLRTVGCMTNMLPLRIPVDDVLSMAELADQIATRVWELQARQRFAYGDIVTALKGGTGGASPMFDVTYSYLTIPDAEEAARHWKDSGVLASGYSLDAVNIIVRDHERDGSLDVDLFYADDVFDANYRFEDTLRHVLTLIERALDEPAVAVGDIDMLTTEDHTQLDAFAYGVPIDV
jgi:polyketide synthase 12